MMTRTSPVAAATVNAEPAYSSCAVARMIGCSIRYVQIACDAGQIACWRLPFGRRARRIPHGDLARFMRENGIPLERLPPLPNGQETP